MLIPLFYGALFAAAIIAVWKGSISIIAIGAGSLILGIAVNYALHFLTHHVYEHSIESTLHELAFPLTIGSATTIGGFLCLQWVDSPVLRDLGLFAGLCLAGAAVATLWILPHFLVTPGHEKNTQSFHALFVCETFLTRITRNKVFFWIIILCTPVFLYFLPKVTFETSLYHLNYMSPELQASEQIVNSTTAYYQKSIFAINSGTSYDAMCQKQEALNKICDSLKEHHHLQKFSNGAQLYPSKVEQQALSLAAVLEY
jgi:predicted exporter